MNTNTKSYKVVIDGEEYNLVSDEGEAHLLQIAGLVNQTIVSLASQLERVDKQKIAVLAALQLASRYMQSEASLVQYKEQETTTHACIERILSLL